MDVKNDTAEKSRPPKKRVPFKDLPKADRILRAVALCLAVLFFLSCLGVGIYHAVSGDPENRLLQTFALCGVSVLPFLLELIMRSRLPSFLLIIIYVFMYFAGLMGVALNFYNRFEHYDTVIHGIFGYIAAAVGLFAIVRTKNYGSLNTFGAVLFTVCFALAVGALWEIWEYATDCLGIGNSQGWQIEGGIFTDGPLKGESAGVVRSLTDTMTDIIMNTIGACVFGLQLLISRLVKKDLLIGSMVRSFEA